MGIFEIKTEQEFISRCIENFLFQYQHVKIYRDFVDLLKISPQSVKSIYEIPFLPIEMFKNHSVVSDLGDRVHYFQSSGTTQMNRSKHWILDFELYEKSIYNCFCHFFGHPEEFIFLGLLPNYLENNHSSLIHMVDYLMKTSEKPENGYFLHNYRELFLLLKELNTQKKKVILFGVSFALLDFLDSLRDDEKKELSENNDSFFVMETGGMKGRKKEMTKDALLKILQEGFGNEKIYSEYSMTELFSQAYSFGNNVYQCPHWMRILVRDLEDPFSFVESGKTGAINIIDLANKNSCSFIATQDLGKIISEQQEPIKKSCFQVLGRIDHSDIRGCSLLVS